MVCTSACSSQAILLDRDGVINRERADYVKSWAEFEWLPGALCALQQLAQTPWPVLVITNQSAIGRKIVHASEVDAIHERLRDTAARAGGRIDAFFVCPHHPDEQCACRKPKPGLLLQAAAAFHLDLTKCVFIGDSWTDYEAANAAGCRAVLVNTGRQDLQAVLEGQAPQERSSNLTLMPNLLSAVEMLIAERQARLRIEK